MKDWVISVVDYFLSNSQEVLWGGVCAVSLVIFVLGCFKPLIKRWVSSSTLRKVLYAWLSVLLNIPSTAVSFWLDELPTEHFWVTVLVNAVGTVLVYFVYENTALRNALHWLGKKIITLLLSQPVHNAVVKKTIQKEAQELLSPTKPAEKTSRYNEKINL